MADLNNELDLNVPAAPSLTLDAAPAAPTLTLDPAADAADGQSPDESVLNRAHCAVRKQCRHQAWKAYAPRTIEIPCQTA